MTERRRDGQGGFSLIELVVTIAILGILTFASLFSYSIVTGRKVKNCSVELQECMDSTKTYAMSKTDGNAGKMTLMIGTDKNIYVKLYATDETKKIGDDNIKITYEDSAGTLHTLTETTPLDIAFSKSTGAFKPTIGSLYCRKIYLQQGSRKLTLVLEYRTGKYYLQ